MKLVVGLGNPGRKYEQTRHNVGFMVAAKLAALVSAGPSRIRFEGELAESVAGSQCAEKLVILCPHTYMNASGKSVRRAFDFYKLSPDDVLVICDDLNLPSGRLRVRPSGSAGGQKGLADIIRHLGTDAIARLRIGIGTPPQGWDAADYVLGKFSADEQDNIDQAIQRSTQAVIDWANQDVGFVMNRYNADPEKPKPTKKPKTKPNPKPKRSDKPESSNGDSSAGDEAANHIADQQSSE